MVELLDHAKELFFLMLQMNEEETSEQLMTVNADYDTKLRVSLHWFSFLAMSSLMYAGTLVMPGAFDTGLVGSCPPHLYVANIKYLFNITVVVMQNSPFTHPRTMVRQCWF
jgi:hypothetical protein